MFKSLLNARWPNIDHMKKANSKAPEDEIIRYERESELDDKIDVLHKLDKLIPQHLPEVYYTGPVEQCDFSQIQTPFIIKTRCQCGNSRVVHDHSSIKQIIDFYKKQWSYRGRNNDVIIEEYLSQSGGNKFYYELLTFGGRVKSINYNILDGIKNKDILAYYPDWTRHNIWGKITAPLHVTVPRPDNLDKIIELAEKCAQYYLEYTGIPHVRVSVYDINGRLYFGEYTGGSNGGNGPPLMQSTFGNWWLESEPTIFRKPVI